ncbi:MAG: GNAT family N-acetyltransferase [Sporichthyaceae bacterium]
MDICALDPANGAEVDEVLALWAAAQAVDRPLDPPFAPTFERGRLLHPLPDEPSEFYLARRDGRLVGVAVVELPHLDNVETAWAEVIVAPEARRRGVGTALWEHVAEVARAAGRKLVVFETVMGGKDEEFARMQHAELGIYTARRQLRIDEAVLARGAELEAHALPFAREYDLHSFYGPTPEQWIDGVAYLNGRMSTDAPLDDLEWEPEAYDADRIRGRESRIELWGQRVYTTLAVHRDTGTVVGFTNIGVCVDDLTAGHQWNTIVDPEHRGHRLGVLLKVANLRFTLTHCPTMATVLTWNAVSNGPMIEVNEAMGFRLFDHWGEWQVRL